MPFRLSDKIAYPSRLTAEQAWAKAQAMNCARPVFTKELIFKSYELCQRKGWDFANMFAQMCNETGNFKSQLYQDKGNPGGIGKTGTDVSTGQDLSRTYGTGAEAAYAMAIHTHVYHAGAISASDELYPYIYLDPRYNAALIGRDTSGKLMAGTVKTLGDWNVNGRWAELVNSRYGDNIMSRGNELFPNITNQTGETPVATWQQQLDVMFGAGKWSITQGWAVDSGAADYSYGLGHGLDGHQHTGLDVGVPYGTRMYAPAEATVVCGGTGVGTGVQGLSCDAFNDWGDGDGSGSKKGVGRIELLFPDGRSLIYGHSRTSAVKPGDKVARGTFIGTSGGMNGAHSHLEARRFVNGDYILIDPKTMLASLPTTSVPIEPGGEPPVATAIDYSKGKMPTFTDFPVAEARKFAGYIDPSAHIIRGFVIHSAYGYLESTAVYFAQGNALTDYMVGNMLDGVAGDGKLYRFNNPFGGRYSHASGTVDRPIEDAAKFLELFGPNASAINMYTTALERTCDSSGRGAVTEKEHRKRVELIAYHANWYGQYLKNKTGKDLFTWETYPIIPSENNRRFTMYHGQINYGKRNTCPDAQVRATMARIDADVKALLKSWQTGTTTPPIDPPPPVDSPVTYATPKPIENLAKFHASGMNKDVVPAVVSDGDMDYFFVYDRVKAIRDTPRRQTAEADALKIGPDIKAGEEFSVMWLFETADNRKWYLTSYWTRVAQEDTTRISDVA